jgi:predicted ribosome quality control (RQC) complex YloA/Tae2 family protein
VLELDCEQHDASSTTYRVLLIVEAMGRRGNLVLVDADGTILDAARRSPPSRNPRRPVLPHLPYVPPPPQDRLLPEQLSPERLAEAAAGRPGPLARLLSDTLAGLSPLAGRELAFRAAGRLDASLDGLDWSAIVASARAFLAPVDTHVWEPPTLAGRDGGALDYAPYRLTHLEAQGAQLETFGSISEAIGAAYARQAEQPARRGDPLLAERRALLPGLERASEAGRRRIRALELQLEGAADQREPLRRAGELLLAYQADVPAGASEVELDGEHIRLDPLLGAVDNAQVYFARYRKAREAEARVPELLEAARQHVAYLEELQAMVEVADQMDAIRALRREVGAATSGTGAAASQADGMSQRGAKRGRPRDGRSPAGGPHRRVALGNGWEALVGTSAAGNAAVTFDLAGPDDLWLHARGLPGAHVILRRPTRSSAEPPEAVVERAAQLAAWHSAGRTSGRVEVDVAPRRQVRKIPNGPPGLVRYSGERTLRVEARPAST